MAFVLGGGGWGSTSFGLGAGRPSSQTMSVAWARSVTTRPVLVSARRVRPGAGRDSIATARILAAATSECGVRVVEELPAEGSHEIWRQVHGGVTATALAAYAAFRDRLQQASLLSVGSRQVLDHLGELVLVTAVEADDLTLLLSGLTWGYRGTGPTGLAAVLTDLGAFPELEEAASWVASLPIDESWHLDIAG